jgi:hypothetical protein
MFELKSQETPNGKRRAEMSWVWPAPNGLYIVFISKNDDGSFTVKYSSKREDGRGSSLSELTLPSFEVAEKLSITMVEILKAAWSDQDAKVSRTDLRGTPEF